MNKDKKAVVERLRARIKPENKSFVVKNLAICDQIFSILAERRWSQKDLAQRLGKHESEISRLLSGLHNFTLESIVKMEVILGKDILVTSDQAKAITEPVKESSLPNYFIVSLKRNVEKQSHWINQKSKLIFDIKESILA